MPASESLEQIARVWCQATASPFLLLQAPCFLQARGVHVPLLRAYCTAQSPLPSSMRSPRPGLQQGAVLGTMLGHLLEGSLEYEGTTRRGTNTPVHHPEKRAGYSNLYHRDCDDS